MKDYDATEVAFKNGQKKGDSEGYQRGFGDGLAAAGIAPIQWVDGRILPFKPEKRTDYVLIFRRQSDLALVWTAELISAVGLNPDDVLFWCPVNYPDVDEEDGEGGSCDVQG